MKIQLSKEAQVLAKLSPYAADMERINAIQDPELQGYASAPVLCEMLHLSPRELRARAMELTADDVTTSERDAGLIRWCDDQEPRH